MIIITSYFSINVNVLFLLNDHLSMFVGKFVFIVCTFLNKYKVL